MGGDTFPWKWIKCSLEASLPEPSECLIICKEHLLKSSRFGPLNGTFQICVSVFHRACTGND